MRRTLADTAAAGIGGRLLRLLASTLLALAIASEAARADGTATLLAVNDVYRLNGADDGAAGGMPRVRALRAELERSAPDLLFLHAGDFLSPSFLGRTYEGAQMIDIMNIMDGTPEIGRHDARMFVTFGNHEFDDTHCTRQGPLADLVGASEFTWLAGNLDFTGCAPLSALGTSANVAENAVVEAGGLRLGLYSLTIARSEYSDIVLDPVSVSCAQVADLRARGVDAVVALTHLAWADDLALLGLRPDGAEIAVADRACADAPDIVVGGHDHTSMALPSRRPRLFKADADAVSAWVIRLTKSGSASLAVEAELVSLDDSRPADPLAQRLADMWIERHDERFCLRDCIGRDGDTLTACLRQAANGACLTGAVARAASRIETEELVNRSLETGFGDWLADRVREIGGVEVALVNAGAIRLNYNLPPGTDITRRHLEEMFPFANRIVVRAVPGYMIWSAMVKALAARGEGAWLHFSGMAVNVAVADGLSRLDEILVRRANGALLPVGPDTLDLVTVASLSFVLADGDGHGFALCPDLGDPWACKAMLEEKPQWPLEGDGADLAGFVRRELLKLGTDPGLKLATDGRLCEPTSSDCLIDRWRERG